MSNNSPSKKFAKAVSTVLNPGFLIFAVLIIAILVSPMTKIETAGWIMAIVIFNGVIPGLLYEFFTGHGFIFDDTLHNTKVHRERVLLFGTFLVLIAIELLIMIASGKIFQPFLAVLVSGAIGIVIAGAISYFWKMSMHSTGIIFFVLMMIIIFGWSFWPLIFFIPLVWWSRLVLYRHTIWQLIGGAVFSLIIVFIVFNYFGLL